MQRATKVLLVLLTLAFTLGTAQPVRASLINGGFETPIVAVPEGFVIVDASLIPGWQTTATDNAIEIWQSGHNSTPSYEGGQHAELNANLVSTLYQDVAPILAGSIVGWQFAHRGRWGADTMEFTLTDLGADNLYNTSDDTVLYSRQFTDGSTSWSFYQGSGIVSLGNTVRFSFVSVSAAGGVQSIGNFIDAADFGVGVGTPEPGTALLLGAGLGLAAFLRFRRA